MYSFAPYICMERETDHSRSQMLKSMGGGAGGFDPDAMASSAADVESDDSDDDGPPPLEEAEPKA